MNNYLDILKESLVKKIEVLKKIKEATFSQKEILSEESFDMEAFDSYVDEKDGYIDELTKLDEGFDSLYKKVSKELEGNKEKYTAEISEMKQLITEITELSSA
ncbi:MAG: flagellar export chaperone FlgN, partial [Lachnospiraceae bacterium]|nr:flagellar export chaperone FlgN [Lachnospiraceae bacterium]